MSKRVAIVGTAPSWIKTPWDDPTLEIWSLNDAYCNGLRRIDRWFDLHPIDKMFFRKREQKIMRADEVPPGSYVRPEGHIDWLREMAKTIPVYLKDEPPAGWPVNAKRFPIEQMDAEFGTYWASGPSYMVALAMVEGYDEIHVYGIHLSTQQEYIEQRSNFEHLLGIARGRGIKVVMAEDSPVMKHGWRYGYEPRPERKPSEYEIELAQVAKEKNALISALVAWPVGKDKSKELARLQRLQIIELDCKQQLGKRQGYGTLTCKVVAA